MNHSFGINPENIKDQKFAELVGDVVVFVNDLVGKNMSKECSIEKIISSISVGVCMTIMVNNVDRTDAKEWFLTQFLKSSNRSVKIAFESEVIQHKYEESGMVLNQVNWGKNNV